jgi:hypothetical protein
MAGGERDGEPKPFGKGAFDGDMGPSSRAGRIRVLEGLAADLEGRIQPVVDQITALRALIEQEREALFMDARRAQRALERANRDDDEGTGPGAGAGGGLAGRPAKQEPPPKMMTAGAKNAVRPPTYASGDSTPPPAAST